MKSKTKKDLVIISNNVQPKELEFEIKNEEYNSEYAAGYVISQEPPYQENYTIKEGETITVIISKGRNLVIVPKVIGKTVDEAKMELEELGLLVNIEEELKTLEEEEIELSTKRENIKRTLEYLEEEKEKYVGGEDYINKDGNVHPLMERTFNALNDTEINREDYKYYTKQSLQNYLGIEKVKQSVLINWKTRDVISVEGIEKDGVRYYRYEGAYKPTYTESESKDIRLTTYKEINGDIKKLTVGVTTEDNVPVSNFTLKYKLENEEIYKIAEEIKLAFYGNRIVMFAPLYLSNYCVNGCLYCPYHFKNKHITRKKLTQEEVKAEVIALQDMGHKRLAIEAGEDPVNNPIEYILECIKTICQ